MLEILKKLMGDKKEITPQDKGLNLHVAICVLLLEAAYADGECSAEEKQQLVSTLTGHYSIPAGEIESLMTGSNTQRNESVDIFTFTRYLNNNYSKQEKIEVMEAVWRIILIDNHLEAHEDHFAHKLANLLRLTHKELIDAKLKAREQLQEGISQSK